MDIKEALLSEVGLRLSTGRRWLVIDELYVLGGEFVVYEHKPYAKKVMEIYRGEDEEEAVRILTDN